MRYLYQHLEFIALAGGLLIAVVLPALAAAARRRERRLRVRL